MQWRPCKRFGLSHPHWDGNSAEPEAGYGSQWQFGTGKLWHSSAFAKMTSKSRGEEIKVNCFFSLPSLGRCWCFGKSLVASAPELSVHIHMGISIFLGHFSCGLMFLSCHSQREAGVLRAKPQICIHHLPFLPSPKQLLGNILLRATESQNPLCWKSLQV